MKFTLISLFALVSVALAVSQDSDFIKRQTDGTNAVPLNQPAMVDAQGNIVPFDSANVYLANKAAGH